MSMYSTNDWRYYSSDELCHYGILGQKWGIRRYQNPDGSLTEAGKARREQLTKQRGIGILAGGAVGGAAGLAAGGAAAVGFSLATGIVAPYLQFSIVGLGATSGAAAFGSLMNKYGEMRLDRFDLKYGDPTKPRPDNSVATYYSPKKAIDSFHKDMEAARNVKTGEEHDLLEQVADYNNAKRQAEIKEYYNGRKNKLMSNARVYDKWDMDFIEATQNKEMDRSQKLTEYDSYLNNPTDYWLNRDERLKKYEDKQ